MDALANTRITERSSEAIIGVYRPLSGSSSSNSSLWLFIQKIVRFLLSLGKRSYSITIGNVRYPQTIFGSTDRSSRKIRRQLEKYRIAERKIKRSDKSGWKLPGTRFIQKILWCWAARPVPEIVKQRVKEIEEKLNGQITNKF